MRKRWNILLAALVLTGAVFGVARATDAAPQFAEPADIRIFEPYIGRFRSQDFLFDDGETAHHFLIDYQWYDEKKTLVKYEIEMAIPSQDRRVFLSEGFYGFDPVAERLFVFGAFKRGSMGWGAIGAFDHDSGAREVWVETRSPEGEVMHVRDAFTVIDENRWRNETRIKVGEGDWALTHEAIYTRIDD